MVNYLSQWWCNKDCLITIIFTLGMTSSLSHTQVKLQCWVCNWIRYTTLTYQQHRQKLLLCHKLDLDIMSGLLWLQRICQMYSTVQYSTVQYSTVQYSTVQYSTVQYSTVQYSTVETQLLTWHCTHFSMEQHFPTWKEHLHYTLKVETTTNL